MNKSVYAPIPATTSHFSEIDGAPDWRLSAACLDLPPQSVFTLRRSEAGDVLRACNQCPIRRECEAVVDPTHSWFDGVSGGRLWRNGREVRQARTTDAYAVPEIEESW
ncbi:WhiB family transcriptional regulator [Streptomyces sp. NPDC006733]|uniref:WhiB family transcriptional regulator n=1 Tax=Streptomyces sp. NPDC006733 TaxID=3155460 RepID=UPI003411F599